MAEIVNCSMNVTDNDDSKTMSCKERLDVESFIFTVNNRNSFTVNFNFTNELNEVVSQSHYYGE